MTGWHQWWHTVAMTPKLFKRAPGGDWYCRFMVRGRRYLWSTKSDDAHVAKERAKAYRNDVVAGAYHLAAAKKSGGAGPIWSELFTEYEKLPIPASAATRKANISAMKVVLAAAGMTPLDRVDRVGAEMATGFQKARINPAAPSESATVSCNSTLRKARSLFSKRCLAFYPAGWLLPKEHIRDFLDVPLVPVRVRQRPVPTDEAIAAADKGLAGFPDEMNAYLLAKYAGLRPVNIKAARWDWLQGEILLVGGAEGITKTKRSYPVRLAPQVIAMLTANKVSNEYIVGDTPKATVERRLVPMLRAYGFPKADPLYSLRRWHASWRYTNQGMVAAQMGMGHTSPTVTMQHYARALNAPDAIPFSGPTVPPAPSPLSPAAGSPTPASSTTGT